MGALINRDADNWRPLFAVANLIGSDWPGRIRKAAVALAPRESESVGALLLADIRKIFDDKAVDRLTSVEICEALAAIEGRPWADWKAGKAITPNQLARLLKGFAVAPESIYPVGGADSSRRPKGYYRHRFDEAWQRYLDPEHAPTEPSGVNEPLKRYSPTATGTSTTFRNATSDAQVADQKCKKSNNDGPCSGVAVQKPENGFARADGESWPPVCDHCGAPERPNDPVQTCAVNGEELFLHRACQAEWLAGPDPNDWSFSLEDAP
jgi:Protein of unknown function (DUF3631)